MSIGLRTSEPIKSNTTSQTNADNTIQAIARVDASVEEMLQGLPNLSAACQQKTQLMPWERIRDLDHINGKMASVVLKKDLAPWFDPETGYRRAWVEVLMSQMEEAPTYLLLCPLKDWERYLTAFFPSSRRRPRSPSWSGELPDFF